MWKDATGFVTSFKTKQLPSRLLATALGSQQLPGLLLATALGGQHLAHYRLPAPLLRSISQQYVVTASHLPSNAARSTFYVYPYKHTLPVRFITSSRDIVLLQYMLLRTQTPISPLSIATQCLSRRTVLLSTLRTPKYNTYRDVLRTLRVHLHLHTYQYGCSHE